MREELFVCDFMTILLDHHHDILSTFTNFLFPSFTNFQDTPFYDIPRPQQLTPLPNTKTIDGLMSLSFYNGQGIRDSGILGKLFRDNIFGHMNDGIRKLLRNEGYGI